MPTGMQNLAEMGYDVVEENVSLAAIGEDGPQVDAVLRDALLLDLLHQHLVGDPGDPVPGDRRGSRSRSFLALISWGLFIVRRLRSRRARGTSGTTINPPGVPFALKFLVVPIEFFSKFLMRPFSLAVRLFANMTAGHVLLTIFAIMTNELLIVHNSGIYQVVFAPLPFLGLVAFTGFELLVAVLQAYIFTILTAVYITESVHPEH